MTKDKELIKLLKAIEFYIYCGQYIALRLCDRNFYSLVFE